jgi:alkaline phosphatase D
MIRLSLIIKLLIFVFCAGCFSQTNINKTPTDKGDKVQLPLISSLEMEQFNNKHATARTDVKASKGHYLDMVKSGSVNCNFNVKAGNYHLTFWIRKSDKDDIQRMGLFINGKKYSVLQTKSTSWTPYLVEFVALDAGSNLIEIRDSEGNNQIDALDIDKVDIEYIPPAKNIGPMVGYTTHNKSAIWYYAGQGRAVELRYGKKGAASTKLMKQNMPPRPENNFTSLAELTDLVPATDYQYQIWVDGKKAREGSFSTAPIPHQPVEYNYLFASCISLQVSKIQKAWDAILKEDYDFQLFHGDNVYANSTAYNMLWGHHMAQRSVSNFAEVLSRAPTFATWDDHDFGPNDSDGNSPGKEESLRLFKDVWANPSHGLPEAPGVFYTYMWGDVQYFVLDNRYHRTKPGKGPDNTQLGARQREWLLDGLKKSRAPFKVILSGGSIQRGGEKWAEYEVELKTIMNFIRDNKIYGVMFQGGDVHIVYFKKYDNNAQDEFFKQTRPALLQYETEMGYPVYDIISSGVAKHPLRPWAIVNVNTKLADPKMTFRFYEEEKLKEEHVLKLSDLTHAGVKDLLPHSPYDGQKLLIGSTHTISWTTVGEVDRVDLEYKTDRDWIPIVTNLANSGAYVWKVPNTPGAGVKIRIRHTNGNVVGENQGYFKITSAVKN